MQTFSKLCEYSLRAIIILAKQNNKKILVKSICNKGSLPIHFTRKGLQILSHHGIVEASRGPTGGYLLKKSPKKIKLIDIVKIFDNTNLQNTCILGPKHCTTKKSCSLNALLIKSKNTLINGLNKITINDLL